MKTEISKNRKAKGLLLRMLTYLSAALIFVMLAGIIGYIMYRGIPGITWSFLT